MFRKIAIAILTMTCLFSASIFAVGLGEIEQSSGLNQPLRAEIPLLSAGDLAEYEVIATLASNKEFEKVGVDRVFFLNGIKFETVRDENNQIVIKVTSHSPVKEPFLNFVVELNWPNGRILREYTLLLDPPVFEKTSSATIEQANTEPEPRASVRQNQPRQSNRAEPRAPRSNYDSSETGGYSGSTWGPVGNTDTLWGIASSVRPDRSVSIQQTLVAIYRANPDAFSNGNINNLKQGKVLNIPDRGVISNVPQRAALQDVVMQNRQWRSGGARKIVSRGDNSGSGSSDGSGGSRLSLATESDPGSAEGYGSDVAQINQVRDQLNRSQEESATLQAENEALRARLAEILEKAEQTSESVINVEDVELAALGQTTESDETTITGSQVDDTLDSTNTDTDQASDNQLDDGEDVASVTKPSVKRTVPTNVIKPKAKDKGVFEQIIENDMLLWGSVGIVAIIFFLLVFWRMKKRMEDEDFQDDLVASAGAGSMDTTETFELPDVGDDMLVELDMDDDEPANTSNADESFDPLGEADIYIAYGKHEQAQSLLMDAIEDNPVRADLKVKLMECYAETDEKEKFEALAEEVSEAVDADDWHEQVASMRSQAWGNDAIDTVSGDDEDDEFDLPSTEDIFGDDDDDELDVDFDEDDLDDDILTDDNMDNASAELDHIDDDSVDNSDSVEDLDDLDDTDLDDIEDLDDLDDIEGLDDLDDIEVLDDLEDGANDIGSVDSDSVEEDFVIDDDEDSLASSDDEFSLDDDDLGFEETGDFDDDSVDGDDEIATKLDLARAYVDMGDSDGAKEILEDVITNGTEEQKSEAQALIDKSN